MANGNGGAMAPTNYGGNMNAGQGVAKPPKGHKPHKPHKPRPHKPRPANPPRRHNHPYLDMAQNDAQLAYGGAEQSLQQRGLAIPSWFNNYRTQLQQQQTELANRSDPIVAQAQQSAQQAGQVTPGVDTNSEAGHDAVLAAAARKAMQDVFTTVLKGYGQANQDFLTGQKTVSSAAELGSQQDLARDTTALKKEKGAYVQSQRAKHKDEARQAQLENAAFGLKAADTAADNARQDRTARQQERDKNREVITSGPFAGFTKREVRNMSPAEKAKLRAKAKNTGKGKADGGGLTAGQITRRDKAKVDLRKGISAIKRSLEGKTTAPAGFWGKAYNDLLDGGYDPMLARAVIQIARFGKAKSGLASRILREYGIKNLPHGKPFHVPAPYTLNPPPQAPGPNGQPRPT